MKNAPAVRETLEDVTNPNHSALVIIDVQNDLCHEDCQAMLPRLEQLISAARSAGVEVIYVQNTTLLGGVSESPVQIARRRKAGRRPDVTVDGTWGHQFVDRISPHETDTVVRKHRMNCFEGTDLDLLLRIRGIETVVCAGVATHGCVLSTSTAAVAKDYYTVVVSDCSASWDEELHDSAVRLLEGVAHYVVTADELLEVWKRAADAPLPLLGDQQIGESVE